MKAIRYLLFPFAIIYDFITTLRNLFYDKGIFKSTEFDLPVIAVGNLSTGGTGKSPQIEYLIRLLKDDYKVAVLSRGYKRRTKGFIVLNDRHNAEDVGDEPLQFFSKFKEDVTVAVDADRTNGIQQLISTVNPEVILLDDAFQHRKVKAGYYILLTKFNELYCDDFILPTGNLRESRRGSKRANSIIVTKCPEHLSEAEMTTIRKKLKVGDNQKVYFSTIGYNKQLKGSENITLEELQDKDLVLVTGIANPDPLLAYLKKNELRFTHINYPDHHNFTDSDISKIEKTLNSIVSEKKLILTTEKDYMRLQDKISNLVYISIETRFLAEEKLFTSDIVDFIKG
ncbi:tetraacyldisaccharide 4'-kinase [Tenacibaculum jejuense]|uniref:Tetraacyldisaccharide 4'-kinase n=1 Tax=Tenacibaculum jejuense TaxID=584609 RepID=A0A238U9E9_9FLAO|nr:tetraacyldisaccharide 4'-kinase [Tenacibaculum jejuense]SNR15040.1 Tetraacyldisaccharide 4'-kinase [Tenacibaculum jejuense]